MTRGQLLRTVMYVAVAFLVTMAVLLRYYVYDRGLTLPLEQRRTVHLGAAAATYLDTATFQVRTGVPVTSTVSLYGDPAAGDGRTAVWVEFSSLETGYGQRIDYHERRTAFDRRTGLTVNCCGEYIDDDTGVRQKGLAFRLPFGAEQRGYPIFDPVLKRQVTLRYEREEDVEGLPAYRYSYTVGPAKVEDLPDQVPGRVLGLPAWKLVSVARYVMITKTMWVEPESGLPLRVREQRVDTLRTPDQVDRVVAFRADLVTDAGDVSAQVFEAAGFRRWALMIRDVFPVVCLVLALLVLPAGALVRRRLRRDGSAPAQDQQEVPGHDLADAG
ncbi:DUF3068 domain-containing protein [Sphaerisporangium corydalis]|uniref:DUF3068 domain-containing protein n=1 Tax=Sphaerisporangium corydalis TaxID=1441875 RepID=A0ABV9ECT8_9ACTN|nr:DUF3068 domain-containing protein [Sphaerisporangium corydalis]